MSGVTTLCFAASYAVALLLEISRLWFHSRVRSVILWGFAGAGLIAQTAFLYYRAAGAVGAPLSSEKDWYLVAAWVVAAVYLCLSAGYPKAPFGLFLLPLTLILIGIATFWAKELALPRAPASRVWGAVHGLSIAVAAVSVFLGFMAGLMYYVQTRQLKRKRLPGRTLRLPSLEWLQRANSHALGLSVLMLSIGVASGMILNRIDFAGRGMRVPWSDPVVLSTLLLWAWLVAALAISALYRPVRQGHKVAYLTMVSFVFLVIMLIAGLLLNSRHWERSPHAPAPETVAAHVSADRHGSAADPHCIVVGGRPC